MYESQTEADILIRNDFKQIDCDDTTDCKK